ncbi:hypothetical protein ACN26Y_18980 [Micromonospora sp. WMMD558]|uniref:hypothetical protein n=1 Tax=Micromonospora sp. WMMD558 TaxID=3403462 RepID=UPI003BF4C8FA
MNFSENVRSAFRRGDTDAVVRMSEAEIERARAAGDPAGEAKARYSLARVAIRAGDLAFPTVTQATNDDSLAAAVDALTAAMYAHGPAFRTVAAVCRAAFPGLDRPPAGDIAQDGAPVDR